MKVAVSCDYILQAGHQSRMLKSILQIFPEARLYALAHRPGQVGGGIEERRICSSYLSHLADTVEKFYKLSHLAPAAAKGLRIPDEVELVFNLTSGFSQGIRKAQGTRQISFLYDDEVERRPTGWLASWARRWRKKAFAQADELWVGQQRLLDCWQPAHPQVRHILPGIALADFPLCRTPGEDFVVVAAGLDKQLRQALACLPHKVSNAAHSCQFASLLRTTRALVDFSPEPFPALALAALACGRPVVLGGNPGKRDFLQGEGVFHAECAQAVPGILASLPEFDGARLRRLALPYSEGRFKSKLRSLLR